MKPTIYGLNREVFWKVLENFSCHNLDVEGNLVLSEGDYFHCPLTQFEKIHFYKQGYLRNGTNLLSKLGAEFLQHIHRAIPDYSFQHLYGVQEHLDSHYQGFSNAMLPHLSRVVTHFSDLSQPVPGTNIYTISIYWLLRYRKAPNTKVNTGRAEAFLKWAANTIPAVILFPRYGGEKLPLAVLQRLKPENQGLLLLKLENFKNSELKQKILDFLKEQREQRLNLSVAKS